jgi:GNAT superfamily N-acetyltransferase
VRDLVAIRPIRDDEFGIIAKFTPPERVPTLHCHPTLVATIYEEIVGYASYYLDGAGIFYHGALRVLEAWQQEGIGTRLMQARIAIARDFHAPAHHCLVWTHKPIMARLCERHGMVATARYDGSRTLYVGDLLEGPRDA